jgi:predicted AAA+ superfamily ATPase
VVHQRDQKRQGGAALRRPRKLYLGDPALASIPAALGGPMPSDGGLVENALATALLRHTERDALERFSHPEHLYYWRSSDGREIDFLVTGSHDRGRVEVRAADDRQGLREHREGIRTRHHGDPP